MWWRFEWHFAVGAIATPVLDATKAAGYFADHHRPLDP
jgi:SecD/SecF fusion protein